MVDDKILEYLQRQLQGVIKSYKSKPVSQNGINFYPQLLSINYRQNKESFYSSVNGGLVKAIEGDLTGNILVEARMIDLNHVSNGHSTAYSSIRVPIEYNPRNFGFFIRDCFDSAIIHSCNQYLEEMSNQISSREIKLEKLSREEPIIFEESEKKFELNRAEIIDVLNTSSGKLFRTDKIVDSATANYYALESVRRFVSIENMLNEHSRNDIDKITTQKSAIKTSEARTSFGLSVEFDDVEGRHIEYGLPLTNVLFANLDEKKSVQKVTDDLIGLVLGTKNCEIQESGFYKIIFGGVATGTLVHETIAAHLLSARYIKDNESTIFKDKIGKKVLPRFISIYDKPHLENGWGSYKYDEEGVPAKDIVLVENGMLKTYLFDRSTAAYFEDVSGCKSNGHSRISSCNNPDDEEIPEPRCSNIVVETSGLLTKEDLFKMAVADCMRDGDDYLLFVPHASIGEVDIEDGDITLSRNSLWMYRVYFDNADLNNFSIEDLVFKPVTSAKIIGTPYSILNMIKAMGGERGTDIGMCGSNSGWVPVQSIAPMAYGLAEIEKIGGETNPKRLIEREEEEKNEQIEQAEEFDSIPK